MPKNDVFYASKCFHTEDQAAFRRWLHANAVIASFFIVMFAALVLAGRATKETRAVASDGAAINADLSAASKAAR
jgi:hypothetical protein